jgi:hypothetical protein
VVGVTLESADDITHEGAETKASQGRRGAPESSQLIGWPDWDAWASDAVEMARRRLSDTGKHGTC